jgi:hypothetical protein
LRRQRQIAESGATLRDARDAFDAMGPSRVWSARLPSLLVEPGQGINT